MFTLRSAHSSLHPVDKCELTLLLLMGFLGTRCLHLRRFSRERLSPHDESSTQ